MQDLILETMFRDMFARVNLLITHHLLQQIQIKNGYTIRKNLQAIQSKRCCSTILLTNTMTKGSNATTIPSNYFITDDIWINKL